MFLPGSPQHFWKGIIHHAHQTASRQGIEENMQQIHTGRCFLLCAKTESQYGADPAGTALKAHDTMVKVRGKPWQAP